MTLLALAGVLLASALEADDPSRSTRWDKLPVAGSETESDCDFIAQRRK